MVIFKLNYPSVESPSCILGDFLKKGQCLPVERNTTALGSSRDFTPKTEHPRGKLLSQVTEKYTHLRQFGARSGLIM